MSDILETSMILMFRTRLIVMDLGERQGYIFHLGNRYQHSWLGYAEKRRKSEKVRWRGGWSSGVPGAMINSCFVVRILMNLSSPYRLISKKWFPLRYWVVIETQCKQIAYILSVITCPQSARHTLHNALNSGSISLSTFAVENVSIGLNNSIIGAGEDYNAYNIRVGCELLHV